MKTCLIAALALVALPALAADKKECPAPGTKAPPFSLLMSDGREGVSLRAALEKKLPVVLGFWAWHCEPCKKELPVMQRLADELAGKATFVLVHVGPDEKKMQDKLDDLKVSIRSASDDTGKKQERYCANELPLTYVLDAGGIVRSKLLGVTTDKFEEELLAALKPLGVEKK